jgi:hypothetical protein
MQPEIGSKISPLIVVYFSIISEGFSVSWITTSLWLICNNECYEYSKTQSVGKTYPFESL